MDKKESKEAIAIMQAWVDDVPVQVKRHNSRTWLDGVTSPCWNWDEWEWRIKPEPVEVTVWAIVIDGEVVGSSITERNAKEYAERAGGFAVKAQGTYMKGEWQ